MQLLTRRITNAKVAAWHDIISNEDMQTDGLNAINVVQNLIAHLSDRLEVIQKLPWLYKDQNRQLSHNKITAQTREFIEELMAELSQFGDGSVDPDRTSLYFEITRELSAESLPTETAHQLALVNDMEAALRQFYDQLIALKGCPESLQLLIERQRAGLLHLT